MSDFENKVFAWDFSILRRFYDKYIVKWLNSAMGWTEEQKAQARENLGFGNGEIDDVPMAESERLVKSGGVYSELFNMVQRTSVDRVTSKVIHHDDGMLYDHNNTWIEVLTFEVDQEGDFYASGRVSNDATHCSVAYYDEDMQYLGIFEKQGIAGQAEDFHDYRLTIPENAKYVRIQGTTNPEYDGSVSLKEGKERLHALEQVVDSALLKNRQLLSPEESSAVLENLMLAPSVLQVVQVEKGYAIQKSDGTIVNSSVPTACVATYYINSRMSYVAGGRITNDINLCSVAYYDKNNVFLGCELEGESSPRNFSNYHLNVPDNAYYVKLWYNSANSTVSLQADGMLEELKKDFLLTKEQYLTEQEATNVLSNLKLVTKTEILEKISESSRKAILLSDGSETTISTDAALIYTFELGQNKTGYTANIRRTNNPDYCSVAYYDESNHYLGYEIKGSSTAKSYENYKLTIPSNAKYVKIWGHSIQMPPKLMHAIKGKFDQIENYDLQDKTVAILGASIDTHGESGDDPNAVELTITTEDVGKTLSAYITYYDVDGGLTIGGNTYTTNDIGTEVTFVPTAADVGKVVGRANNYNSNDLDVWWTYVRDYFGCNIIPVCWSGSGLTRNRETETEKRWVTSQSWHDAQIRKCGKRIAGTMNRTAPDVIIIHKGQNDFTHTPFAMLTEGYFDNYDIEYPTSDLRQDGEYGFKEAYFMTIGKLREAYPNAKIVLCTFPPLKRNNYSHFPQNNGYFSEPQYNNAVREIADFCGCGVIEFDKCGITFENMYPTYISDSATTPTHPNAKGHEVMGKCAIAELKKMNFYM